MNDDQIVAVTVPITLVAICAALLISLGPKQKVPCHYHRQVSEMESVDYPALCDAP